MGTPDLNDAMGFLNNTIDRHRRQRQWSELRGDPRPHALAAFARACFAADDRDLAEEVLSFGTGMFPDSEDLFRARAWLLSASAEDGLRVAKRHLSEDRSAAAFLELADAYLSIGRPEDCGKVLREMLQEHGECGTALSWLGHLRLGRLRETFAAVDGKAAMDYFDRAIKTDPDALKPRMLLGEFYFMVGASKLSRETFEELARVCPGHERAEEMLTVLGDSEDAAKARSEDVESLLAEVEDRTRVMATLPGESVSEERFVDEDSASAELERVRIRLEVDGVAFFASRGPAKRVFTDRRKGDRRATDRRASDRRDASCSRTNVDLLAREAIEFGAFAERAACDMDLGSANGIVIEGEEGVVVLEQKRGQGIVAVLPEGHDNVDSASVTVRDSLERLLRGS